MKKLIAIAVVLVLAVGTAFAVDLGGTVFGHVNVIQGDTGKDANGDDNKVAAGGEMDRVRIDGSGEVADGAFGGYIRLQGGSAGVDSALAWWKPIDQFKLTIGKNSDGIWSKEGVSGWMFNQMPNDSGIAINPGIWFGDGWGSSVYNGKAGGFGPMHSRYTFFEGINEDAALLEIKPIDMLGVNIGIPFMAGGEAADVFKASVVQLDLNLDFGNIAITYDGGGRAVTAQGDAGGLFIYFGGSFGDLGLDVGFAYHLAGDPDKGQSDKGQPIGVGLGVKYATDSFGVKFKLTAALGGEEDKNTYLNTSILPYFAINDSISAFIHAGLGIVSPDEGDAVVGWFFNPYLRVGAEWGPTFYFGIQVSSDGVEQANGDPAIIKFAVPVSLMVSF